MKPVFGQDKQFTGFCQICWEALFDNEQCQGNHKKKLPKRGRFSGASKSVNKFNDYR